MTDERPGQKPTERFDQSLYDRLLAEADTYAPTSADMPNVYRRHIFGEWYDGWDMCAEVAARIAVTKETDHD